MFEAAYYSEIIRAGIQSISAASPAPRWRWDDPLAVNAAGDPAAGLPRHGAAAANPGSSCSVIPRWCMLSLADFFRTASTIGERDGTRRNDLFAGGVYFVISLSASLLVSWLKKRTV